MTEVNSDLKSTFFRLPYTVKSDYTIKDCLGIRTNCISKAFHNYVYLSISKPRKLLRLFFLPPL